MATYTNSIVSALIGFPFVAFLFTLPYMIYCYRKYGELIWLRVAIVYSFILYLMCAYFLVILPLPDYDEVAALTTQRIQLIPFTAIADIFKEAKDSPNLLSNRAFIQVAFNVLLTVPFGMYLRYYFNCSFKKTVLYSFLLSLFFELTQLTGLYFIYPRSYRLCDVDDLILNTLGGITGYIVITPLLKLLPSRKEIDADSLEKSKSISLMRRLLEIFIDIVMSTVAATLIQSVVNIFNNEIKVDYAISVFAYLTICALLGKSGTIGMIATRICIEDYKHRRVKALSIIARYLMLILIYFEIPSLLLRLFQYLENAEIINQTIRIVFSVIASGCWFILYIYSFVLLCKKKALPFEIITKTQLASETKNGKL